VATYFPETKARTRWNLATWRWWRHRDRLLALLDEQIAATQADSRLAEREDILAMLVQARDEDGNPLTSEDLRDDLVALIGAGHETTAAATAWGAALLSHNPAVRERATVAARDDDEQYLGALVKEVLRIRPPIPVGAGRILNEPFAIGPHSIPAGTLIMIDAWGVHHDPELYPDPERFQPERFLADAPEPYTWLPFGGGAHRCIGAALAELEIKVALATILDRIVIAPADTELAPPARRGITIVPHAGGRINVASGRA
jgi:cytochrome P450 family 135